MEGIIRNAIAACGIVLTLGTTLGGPLINMNKQIAVMQVQLATLTKVVGEIRCEIKATSYCAIEK